MPELGQRTIGQIIDDLGITADNLRDDTMITDAIIIAKTTRLEDGETTVFLATTPGISWIEQRGMIEIARDDARQPVAVADTED